MQSEITLKGLQPYLSFLGTFVQLGAALLLIALFTLLHPYTRRRKYFRTWLNAWIALAVALLALVLRFNLLPSLLSPDTLETSLNTKLFYLVYQGAKLTFFGLLVAGTLRYVRAAPGYSALVGGASFSFLYAALSVWQSADLNIVVIWQAPVAVLALGFCALLILRLPASRRSVGTSIVGGFFSFAAALWAAYFLGFSDSVFAPALQPIVSYNTYLDLIWHISLGFGMVVLLLEDMKHQSDDAHAELAVAHDNLRRASFYDSVTGSLNRQAFADGLGLEAAAAGFGAVIMLDMDDLKRVNDEHGHGAGDAALRYLVDVLRATVRPSDKIYRWGGDEFLIIFPAANTKQVARRMRRVLNNTEPLSLGEDTRIALRVSVGAASFASGEQLAVAIDNADRAMYADKVNRKKALAQEIAQNA
ncbi:MAG TPA: GGDEF domain-containing protein [Longimicrobiales bacterium]|nr:GGDEF domain-containing protein [Longimicrobiales bacterium]